MSGFTAPDGSRYTIFGEGGGQLLADEIDVPLDGNIRFLDLEGADELMARPHLLRPAYLRAVKEYLTKLQRGCDGSRVEYVLMRTDRPLRVALGEYLIRRLQFSKLKG